MWKPSGWWRGKQIAEKSMPIIVLAHIQQDLPKSRSVDGMWRLSLPRRGAQR
jgi:hypothetical protein